MISFVDNVLVFVGILYGSVVVVLFDGDIGGLVGIFEEYFGMCALYSVLPIGDTITCLCLSRFMRCQVCLFLYGFFKWDS